MALGVDIVSAFDGKGIKDAIEEFKKLETNGQKAQFAIQKAALPAAAALAGLAAAAGLAVKGAIEDQQEQAKLAQVLTQVTGATNQTITANEDYLKSIERTTIFAASEMRPALASLVVASGDLEQSQNDLRLAMDIATATGTPLLSVTDALGKAYNGNMKGLQSLSPALKDNIKEGQSLDEVFTELNATFGGATAAATNTAAGQMTLLKNQLKSLSDSFGMALLPIVQAIVPVFASLANFAENNRTAFLALAAVVALLSAAILAATTAIKLHALYQALMKIEIVKTTAATIAASGAMSALKVAMTGLIAAGVFAAVFAGLSAIANAASDADGKIKRASESMTIALSKFGNTATPAIQDVKQVLGEFQILAANIEAKSNFSDIWTSWGKEIDIFGRGATLDIESFDAAFRKVVETSPQAAQQLINALKAQLENVPKTSQAYADLTMLIGRYSSQVKSTTDAQNALNRGFGQTLSLAQVARQAFLNVTQAKYDDMRMNNANTDSLKQYQTQVLGMKTGTAGASKEVKTATEKLADYTAALRGNYDAQRAMTSATNSRISAEKALTTATDNTRKAQEYFNNVAKGFPATSKEAVAASDKLRDAQRRVSDASDKSRDSVYALERAEKNLAKVRATAPDPKKIAAAERSLRDAKIQERDAVLSVVAAEKELAELRAKKADPADVADAERDVERAKYDIEEANFRVLDAEAKLAELRAKPDASPIEIRRAEIDLAEAKLGVQDAVKAVSDAEQKLAEQRNMAATAEELAQAERELERAKLTVSDATDSVKEAEVALAEERAVAPKAEDLAEAERELADAKADVTRASDDLKEAVFEESKAQMFLNAVLYGAKENTDEYKDALDALNKAKEEEADQRRNVASALLDEANASIALAQAIQELNKVTGSTPQNIVNRATAQLSGISTDNPALAILNQVNNGAGAAAPINVTVNAGMGTDGQTVAREIIDVLKQYERANGFVPLVAEYVAYS